MKAIKIIAGREVNFTTDFFRIGVYHASRSTTPEVHVVNVAVGGQEIECPTWGDAWQIAKLMVAAAAERESNMAGNTYSFDAGAALDQATNLMRKKAQASRLAHAIPASADWDEDDDDDDYIAD